MKVLLINPTSHWPCGVGDFTDRLYCELLALGTDVTVFRRPLRGFHLFHELRITICQYQFDAVHLQYPIGALRPSPVQHLLPLGLKTPVIVTIHEFTQLNILRRFSTGAFLLANRLVFTTGDELVRFRRTFPFYSSKAQVVPIGSNIPFLNGAGHRQENIIVYFGLIRPNRGLGPFIELSELSHKRNRGYIFKIVGSVPKRKHQYYLRMLERSARLRNVQWKIGLDSQKVAEELATSAFAYLAYPDGASKRHGSLLAALGNGAAVITRRGQQTPADLGAAVRYANTPVEALSIIDELVADQTRLATLRTAALRWVSKYSWGRIAADYNEIYQSVI